MVICGEIWRYRHGYSGVLRNSVVGGVWQRSHAYRFNNQSFQHTSIFGRQRVRQAGHVFVRRVERIGVYTGGAVLLRNMSVRFVCYRQKRTLYNIDLHMRSNVRRAGFCADRPDDIFALRNVVRMRDNHARNGGGYTRARSCLRSGLQQKT